MNQHLQLFLGPTLCLTLAVAAAFGQSSLEKGGKITIREYSGETSAPYAPVVLAAEPAGKHAKNIILFIGDGMGLSQIFPGLVANRGHLNLERMPRIGFSKTQAARDFVTDSAAGATAIATGYKTRNGAIGVDADGKAHKTILEIAETHGWATGLVALSPITDATPAAFIAHNPSRNNLEAIALDFLAADIEVFIGGGRDHFIKRKDGRNLLAELTQKGYSVTDALTPGLAVAPHKLVCLTARGQIPKASVRGDWLQQAFASALQVLSRHTNGFFLMVEGSLIDKGRHANSTADIVQEVLDLDRTIGMGLEFASRHGHTLVLATAAHETGGMSIHKGNLEKGTVTAAFTTTGHTAVMVPVFAFGPGSDNFQGIYENCDLFLRNAGRVWIPG